MFESNSFFFSAPNVVYECGDECKSLRRKLYAASAFAILFVIVIFVLGGLLYRQYRISRDYRDDPSLSRLIWIVKYHLVANTPIWAFDFLSSAGLF